MIPHDAQEQVQAEDHDRIQHIDVVAETATTDIEVRPHLKRTGILRWRTKHAQHSRDTRMPEQHKLTMV